MKRAAEEWRLMKLAALCALSKKQGSNFKVFFCGGGQYKDERTAKQMKEESMRRVASHSSHFFSLIFCFLSLLSACRCGEFCRAFTLISPSPSAAHQPNTTLRSCCPFTCQIKKIYFAILQQSERILTSVFFWSSSFLKWGEISSSFLH